MREHQLVSSLCLSTHRGLSWCLPDLMREINPDALRKLESETFIVIIDTTGRLRPINVMVQKLGYRLVPVD